ATVSVTGAGGLSLTPTANYANNMNAGTATASFTYAESANHFASSDSEDFTIGKAASVTTVTITGAPFTYTGSAITPATVSVTGAGGLSLTPAPVYVNNTNAGTATASYIYAESANHFASSDSEDFTIGKAASVTTVTITGAPFTYTGAAITPATVSVTGAGGLSLTPAPLYVNNTNAGTATASFTYAESANHFASSDSKDFTIGKAASVTVVTVPAGPYTYTGSAQTPASVSVTGAGGLNLTPAVDYANNVNAGTATASYTYAESANYFASSDSKNFTIGKKVLTITADNKSKYVGQVNPAFTVSYSGFVNGETQAILGGTVSYATDASINSCAGSYDVTPTGLTSSNYNIGFVKGTLTVTAVTLDASASSTPVAIGTIATLRATVSPAVSGVSITFYVDGVSKGTSLTDGTGKATLVVSGLAADVYEVKAIIGSGCSESEVVFLPVYDPAGGFVTGGGWIDSPAGAMIGAKATIVGKANFGFNAKYNTGKNNTTEVDGNTNFQFKAGDIHFSSATHDNMQLVISGAKATYTGTGTVNGVGTHKFRVIAIDGDVAGGGGFDKFRIMIWDNNSSSTLLYDNKRGTSESSDDATVIGGGSIVIHKVVAKGNKRVVTDLVTVPWNTPTAEIEKKITAMGSDWFEGKGIKLNINAESYNPLAAGFYEMKVNVQANEWIDLDEPISVTVLVSDKPLPTDIKLSNSILYRNVQGGNLIGDLITIDPADDQHIYSIAEHSDFELVGKSLVWKGTAIPSTARITVLSTDRAGQTIERVLELIREPRFGDFNMFPNPAQSDVNLEIEIYQTTTVGIRIYDAVGRLVHEQEGMQSGSSKYQIAIDHLSPGLYTVQVKTGQIVMNKRLIKK
ncbi:MBG domain-containing protein, partial [Algoriphagus ratkowskyi]